MVKIEAVIQPLKLDDVKAVLDDLQIDRMVISEVLNDGSGIAHRAFYRGIEYRAAVAMVKVEVLVCSDRADEVVDAIARIARTPSGSDDDGTILVYEVADALRIRNGTRLQYTLS